MSVIEEFIDLRSQPEPERFIEGNTALELLQNVYREALRDRGGPYERPGFQC